MAQSISQEAIGATGLPGATAASRYAGATASGAPTAGTFAVGDYVIDQTGAVYVCTVAGTPGTWVKTGGGVTPAINPTPALNNLQAWSMDILTPVVSGFPLTATANTIYFSAFTPTSTINLTTANKLWYGSASTGGNINMGIYTGNGTTAGTLLCSTGSVAANTSGGTFGVSLTGSATLNAGTQYYFAVWASSTSVVFTGFSTLPALLNFNVTTPSTTGGLAFRFSQVSATSLLSTLTSTPTSATGIPWLGLS